MDTFKNHFSTVAEGYRAFRPTYPPSLFTWLAENCRQRESALDCGCGSGQATIMLAPYFPRVFGVDPSPEQIAQAERAPGIEYRVAAAEASGLADGAVDLVVAGQALHWFDFERFYREVARVCRRSGGVFAAFSYGLIRVGGEADRVIGRLYDEVLGEFWPPERRHVDAGYQTIPFPFPEIPAPPFEIADRWDRKRLLGYLGTWSAVKEYRRCRGDDPLAGIEEELARDWDDATVRAIRWPLVVRAGRVNG